MIYVRRDIPKKSTLEEHKKSAHLKIIEFYCEICGSGFSTKRQILDHHRTVHDRAFVCEICKKSFPHKSILDFHQKYVHLNTREYHCEDCGKRFPGKQQLVLHKSQVHLNIRDFICDVCHKRFALKTNLKQHMLTHQKYHHQPLSLSRVIPRQATSASEKAPPK